MTTLLCHLNWRDILAFWNQQFQFLVGIIEKCWWQTLIGEPFDSYSEDIWPDDKSFSSSYWWKYECQCCQIKCLCWAYLDIYCLLPIDCSVIRYDGCWYYCYNNDFVTPRALLYSVWNFNWTTFVCKSKKKLFSYLFHYLLRSFDFPASLRVMTIYHV